MGRHLLPHLLNLLLLAAELLAVNGRWRQEIPPELTCDRVDIVDVWIWDATGRPLTLWHELRCWRGERVIATKYAVDPPTLGDCRVGIKINFDDGSHQPKWIGAANFQWYSEALGP